MSKTKVKTNLLIIMMACFLGLFAFFVSSTSNTPSCCGTFDFTPVFAFPLVLIFAVIALFVTAVNFALLPRREKTDRSTLLAYGITSLIYAVSIPVCIHIFEKPDTNPAALPTNSSPQENLYSPGKVDFPVYTINNLPPGYTKEPLTLYQLNDPDDTGVSLDLDSIHNAPGIEINEVKNDATGQAEWSCPQDVFICTSVGSNTAGQSIVKKVFKNANPSKYYDMNLPSTRIELSVPTTFIDQQAVELLNSLVPAQ